MKNKEKYAKEIIDIATRGSLIAIKKGEPYPCDKMHCEDCDLLKCNGYFYRNAIQEWAESEYVDSKSHYERKHGYWFLLDDCANQGVIILCVLRKYIEVNTQIKKLNQNIVLTVGQLWI